VQTRSAVIWTLEEFLNSENILQTLIGGIGTLTVVGAGWETRGWVAGHVSESV